MSNIQLQRLISPHRADCQARLTTSWEQASRFLTQPFHGLLIFLSMRHWTGFFGCILRAASSNYRLLFFFTRINWFSRWSISRLAHFSFSFVFLDFLFTTERGVRDASGNSTYYRHGNAGSPGKGMGEFVWEKRRFYLVRCMGMWWMSWVEQSSAIGWGY